MNYEKIDIENWARKEHYRYYTEKLKIEVNMTAPIDVKNLLVATFMNAGVCTVPCTVQNSPRRAVCSVLSKR